MKVLLVSPLGFAITPQTKYAGIERLVWEYSRELVKNHDVTVMGHADSIFSQGVKVLAYKPDKDQFDPELTHYQIYQSEFRKFDVIHDFSHLHLISRFNPNMPSLNIFWHAPALAKYEKAPYNIIALSKWAEREFRRIYHQNAKFQQSICIDTSVYKLSDKKRTDRFITIGRMGQDKGNLNAVMLCKQADVPLDVVGASCGEPEYEAQIKALCDGEKIKYLGEVNEERKIELLQTCKVLLYATNHPEVTSHKIQEAMLCGAIAIVPNIGAMPEIVTHGINGWRCSNESEFLMAIKEVDKLGEHLLDYRQELIDTYSVENVVKAYIPLYEKVAGGLRW